MNSIRFICTVFALLRLTADSVFLRMNISCIRPSRSPRGPNVRRHRETFSVGTFESDICLTFQTCHNSATDKIIGALIDNTNNWDLLSDLLCPAEHVREPADLGTWACFFCSREFLKSACASGMQMDLLKIKGHLVELWRRVCEVPFQSGGEEASLFDLTVPERSITQPSCQLSAEGPWLCSDLGDLCEERSQVASVPAWVCSGYFGRCWHRCLTPGVIWG